jgi:DNA-binding NtrC family response regulator
MKPKILIVDDYVEHAQNLSAILKVNDYECKIAFSAEEAQSKLAKENYTLILLDNKLPGLDGLDFVRMLRKNQNDTPVIMYSAYGDSHLGVESARLGVFDFLPKGDDLSQLYDKIEAIIQKHQIITQQKFDGQYFMQKYEFVGISPQIKKVFETIEQIASTDARVLIVGETGVGKNLLAEIIHKESNRAANTFIWLDCTTIPETLLESELFGHERGAFTGAEKKRMGRLALADRGTLFLDQIDDMNPTLQAKFLRFVETGEFESVGSNIKQSIDIRIISTAMTDLKEQVNNKQFREDLYYRLAQIEIYVPPLRERKEDVIYLARHFARINSIKYKKPVLEFSSGALDALLAYDWPGNVRELQFFIERLIIFKNHGAILEKDIEILQNDKNAFPLISNVQTLREAKNQFEKNYIIRALIENDWNVNKTAKKLGVDRTNLYKKIQIYGITLDR